MDLRARIAALRAVWEETTAINTGSFVRPLGPMLPPVPSSGWEDAADVMDPPKRRRLDSRPKKRKVQESKAFHTVIRKLSSRPGVDADAVINFLSSLEGLTYEEAVANAMQDKRDYKWNHATSGAIREGLIAYFFRS